MATVKPAGSEARSLSLDAFRGFTIMAMLFGNYIATVAGVPDWLRHAPAERDGLTVIDLIFPGFMFIVGVAIPLSLERRLRAGAALLPLLGRIVARAAMLILLGLILGNEDMYDAVATGVPKTLWYLCVPLAALALYASWPLGRSASTGIKILGGAVFVWLLVIFRGHDAAGQIVWLRHADSDCRFGVLGMLGWGYLTCSLVYLLLRGSRPALMGSLGFMIALYMGWKHGRLDALARVDAFVSLGQIFGTTAAVVMAGVVVGALFTAGPASQHLRLRFMVGFGVLLIAAGFLVRPLHGINKREMTDAYALIAAGTACLAYAACYVAVEMAKIRGGFSFLAPVGQNALMAYLLPDVIGRLFELAGLQDLPWADKGFGPGVTNVAFLTCGILVLVRFVTRHRVVVRL